MAEQGFVKVANRALKDEAGNQKDTLSQNEFDFLTAEFGPARDRMAALATTVGTTGSFLLVLVALLVSFATGAAKESDELVAASEAQSLLAQRCSDDSTSPACSERRLQLAEDRIRRERDQVSELQDLNVAQAAAGAAALLGFLLSLGAHMTNPVAGPASRAAPKAGESDGGVGEWIAAVDRLTLKRRWIEAALIAEAVGVGAVAYLAYEVFV